MGRQAKETTTLIHFFITPICFLPLCLRFFCCKQRCRHCAHPTDPPVGLPSSRHPAPHRHSQSHSHSPPHAKQQRRRATPKQPRPQQHPPARAITAAEKTTAVIRSKTRHNAATLPTTQNTQSKTSSHSKRHRTPCHSLKKANSNRTQMQQTQLLDITLLAGFLQSNPSDMPPPPPPFFFSFHPTHLLLLCLFVVHISIPDGLREPFSFPFLSLFPFLSVLSGSFFSGSTFLLFFFFFLFFSFLFLSDPNQNLQLASLKTNTRTQEHT